MMFFPHEEVVFHALNGYLKDGTATGLRVTAPMYCTRKVGGHVAVRINEFSLDMEPGEFLPVHAQPGNEILTHQLDKDRHSDLAWSPEPGSLRRKFRDL